MEIVHVDSTFSIAIADPVVWLGLGLKCISGEAWEASQSISATMVGREFFSILILA